MTRDILGVLLSIFNICIEASLPHSCSIEINWSDLTTRIFPLEKIRLYNFSFNKTWMVAIQQSHTSIFIWLKMLRKTLPRPPIVLYAKNVRLGNCSFWNRENSGKTKIIIPSFILICVYFVWDGHVMQDARWCPKFFFQLMSAKYLHYIFEVVTQHNHNRRKWLCIIKM